MPTHRKQEKKNIPFFVTFTCYQWLQLIDLADAYPAFYKWFEFLKSVDVKILGYVIMPNHFHGILFLPHECPKTINQLLGNGKRFLAYDIIDGLTIRQEKIVIQELGLSVSNVEKASGKKHKVFRTSSDCKEVFSTKMLLTKLDYIHRNPCQGRWNLVDDYTEYPHSSAAFYVFNKPNKWVTDYREVF